MGTTAEKLAYLDATKTAIKDAIVAKGVEIPEGTTFRQYAEKIGKIKTGSTATITFKERNINDVTIINRQLNQESFNVPIINGSTIPWITWVDSDGQARFPGNIPKISEVVVPCYALMWHQPDYKDPIYVSGAATKIFSKKTSTSYGANALDLYLITGDVTFNYDYN